MKDFEKAIEMMKKKNLFRTTRDFEQVDASRGQIGGREIVIFGSNDYLGLSSDPRIEDAAVKAIGKYGFGSTGSRLTSGSRDVFKELEDLISDVKDTQASLVFNTGYMANTGVISAVCDKDFEVFSDRYNHASIVDGIVLSGARTVRYRHCSMESLEKRLKESKSKKKLIVTDGVFSMDGDIAPLGDMSFLAKKYGAILMVDDAHGFGVLGQNGGGTCSHLGVSSKVDIQVGTLSKAVGGIGGYVSGDRDMIDYLMNSSRSFIFSTALPPLSACCAIKAINIIGSDSKGRKRLKELSDYMRGLLKEKGFDTGLSSGTPIIPIILGDEKKASLMGQKLMEDGIYMPAIRVPTVQKGQSRLRASLTALHTKEDVDNAVERISQRWKEINR